MNLKDVNERSSWRGLLTPVDWQNIMRRHKAWIIVGAVILIVASSFLYSRLGGAGTKIMMAPSLPEEVDDFSIIWYQGEDFLGSKEARFVNLLGGKPIVMNFWASNCASCRAEMPHFETVWQTYKGDVLFIGLDVGRFYGFGDQEQSKKELKELGITYPSGTPSTSGTIRELKVGGLPSTSFITPTGQVHKNWVGLLNSSKLTELIEGLLAAS